MRALYVGIALIMVVGGAGRIQANVVGTPPTGIYPIAGGPPIPRAIALGPSRIHHAPTSRATAAGLGLPKSRENPIRLAQTPQVAAPEASSGNPIAAPFKWVGLLVFQNPTDANRVILCTAQFIKPNVLLTAGHCLKDLQTTPTGPWPDLTKGVFWLQYQNQTGIKFPIVCGATNALYALPSNYGTMTKAQQSAANFAASQHDFAMILVNGTSPTGVMPYALDWKGKYTYADRVGYPADILDSAIVQYMGGPVFLSDEIPMGLNSPNLVVQWGPITDFTGGSSGGAWVANFNINEGANTNILIAVTSSELTNYPGGETAAYLTAAEFNPLLASVSNGCK
jgi:hypothetical protein